MMLEYKYSLELSFNDGSGKLIPIETDCITDMIIERNFEAYNRPCIFLELSLKKSLIDKIIANKQKGTMLLKVQKFAVKDIIFLEDYIRSEFFYFLSEQQNPLESVEKTDPNNTKMDDLRKKIMIGLVDVQLTNKSKKLMNQIFTNATNMDILAVSTSMFPMIIEQMLPYTHSSLTLPPLDSVSKLVEYLNKKHCLFNSPYRFFTDFERGYLISSDGNEIKVKGQKINNVIFNIQNTVNPQSTSAGMEVDNKAKAYKVNVDWNEVELNVNNSADKMYNIVEVLMPDGSVTRADIKTIDKKNNYSEKKMCVKAEFNNPMLAKVLARKIELDNTTVTINKPNIDASVLTPDRMYQLNFPTSNQQYSGKYLLASKTEVCTRVGKDFVFIVQLKMRKIP